MRINRLQLEARLIYFRDKLADWPQSFVFLKGVAVFSSDLMCVASEHDQFVIYSLQCRADKCSKERCTD